jgi:hypothetical protein
MPGTLSRSLLRDITVTTTVITDFTEMTVTMTIFWSIGLAMQIVAVDRKIPTTMPTAARTLYSIIKPRLLAWMIQESIRMIWRKKV